MMSPVFGRKFYLLFVIRNLSTHKSFTHFLVDKFLSSFLVKRAKMGPIILKYIKNPKFLMRWFLIKNSVHFVSGMYGFFLQNILPQMKSNYCFWNSINIANSKYYSIVKEGSRENFEDCRSLLA